VPADQVRRLGAEALGTGLLVATVVGSGIMAERLTGDAALALLGNTVPTSAMLFVLITALGPISGAHFNPAVSMVMAMQQALPCRLAGLYMLGQIAGGIAGTAAAHLMFDVPLLVLGNQARGGPSQWFSEGVATFGLVLTIILGIRHRPAAVPGMVAAYIGAAYWFTASTSFANPAVTMARALTDTFSGIRPIDAPAFIVAQLAGAIIALGLCRWFTPKEQAA
jgi:glycerol uptake facilitator-like aquaporin